MIILDTDVLSIAQKPESPDALVLQRHMVSLSPDVAVATTIISYHEQTRGWFEYFSKAKTRSDIVKAYFKLLKHVNDWRNINVVPFDDNASTAFDSLRAQKIRVGTPDLRIAAIALSLNATLITRNLQDFKKVPGLKIEDWTKP